MTREDYLLSVIEKVKTIAPDDKNPNIRVSCGLPSKGAFSSKKKRIGECWSDVCSKDSTHEIFISPTIADSEIVTATLIHEYCHALAGIQAKHGKEFKRYADHFGLEGKMTATYAGEYLLKTIRQWVNELGNYPHAELTGKETVGKKQGTRLLKLVCDCGYTIRVTQKWIDEVGFPTCACGGEFYKDV